LVLEEAEEEVVEEEDFAAVEGLEAFGRAELPLTVSVLTVG